MSSAYGYDPIGRLSSLAYDSGAGADVTFGYGHNPAGQIVSRSVSNPAYDPAGGKVMLTVGPWLTGLTVRVADEPASDLGDRPSADEQRAVDRRASDLWAQEDPLQSLAPLGQGRGLGASVRRTGGVRRAAGNARLA